MHLMYMRNSSYNKGKFLAGDLENKCLRGNRSSKKDGHSKIATARGLRDRRMRLSLDVAKRFFKLQDMLGFDKASNTVQWLLIKSKHAIQDLSAQQLNQSCSLMGVSNSPSSASESEVVLSRIDDQSVITTDKEKVNSCSRNQEKKRHIVYTDHSLAKETRVKARARARKRTTEKRIIKLGCDGASSTDQFWKPRSSVDQVMDQNTNRLEPWIPFGEDRVRLTDQAEYPNSRFQSKERIVDDNSSMMSSYWSPSFLFNNFNYQQNLGPCHEHQFSDLQILGNPWEDINN